MNEDDVVLKMKTGWVLYESENEWYLWHGQLDKLPVHAQIIKNLLAKNTIEVVDAEQ